METQKYRYTDKELLNKWIIFFLDCLTEIIEKLKVKYETYNNLKIALNQRQKEILAYIDEQEIIQIKDLELRFEQYSRNTMKKDLQYFVNEGVILKTGSGRGVKYHSKGE